MKYSELVNQKEIDNKQLSSEQIKWYQKYLKTVKNIEKRLEKNRRVKRAKYKNRPKYNKHYNDLQLMNESIEFFDDYYDLKHNTI
ncbi:MAG: hypothetical protein PQJ44_07120, partial [Sphaerochaetaceae bacterium]|nr:hypothetical protein [Sphaerochaetaceae bacterium]